MSKTEAKVGVDLGLTAQEKKELLEIVKKTVEEVSNGKRPSEINAPMNKLLEKRGAFVTLHKRGMLRGCIGALQASKPLYLTVQEMAEAACSRDPRFRPVTPEELKFLDYEISVLTPFEPVEDIKDIKVGLHGLLVRKGARSGLLLPQVASERNWDVETFLKETCRKAGLHPEAWRERDTQIFMFSADVF
ncbi:MAG: AmmeMemoRadiSam system protein A [Syntrophaceae bacterium]|nr:AmmeMemoRadiSam system protein A [Syntrophaceae bacterium]